MAEEQTEEVTLHSLQFDPDGWRLRCYESPSILAVEQRWVATLESALREDKKVLLTWCPSTSKVQRVRMAE